MSRHQLSFIQLISLILFVTCSFPAGAATFTVTNLLDDLSAGSLRHVIADASNSGTNNFIVFDSSLSGTISLVFGELNIASNTIYQ